MVGLGIAYCVIVLAALWERNLARALYFFGALLITAAVLWMGTGRK